MKQSWSWKRRIVFYIFCITHTERDKVDDGEGIEEEGSAYNSSLALSSIQFPFFPEWFISIQFPFQYNFHSFPELFISMFLRNCHQYNFHLFPEWLISMFLRNIYRIADFLTWFPLNWILQNGWFKVFEENKTKNIINISHQVSSLRIDLIEYLDDVCFCYPIPPASSLSE